MGRLVQYRGFISAVFFWWCLILPSLFYGQHVTDWHGYELLEFDIDGLAAKIVFPKQVNSDHNWIWRARFWGHEPQTDITLLERGFHLVWIEMADLYGSPKAIKIGNTFYQYVREKYDLDEKVVLEGFSRGGLFVYNWALENIGKVACIYADAPVLDIKSWPGGEGQGNGSADDWTKCKRAYALLDADVDNYQDGPIDKCAKLADAKIPLLHVCGAADVVVPYAENTKRFEEELVKVGGQVKVILKEGVGHHPHSLQNPRPIVRFILEHTDPTLLTDLDLLKIAPQINFRERWNNSVAQNYGERATRVAFLGGSITYGEGWRDSIMQYLISFHPTINYEFINAGISSMGSTPGAFRLDKDVLSRGPIDLLFVEAAVNDATNGRSVQAQVRGMEGIVRQTLERNLATDIIMMHFVDQDKMADYNQGNIPEVIRSHETVAKHYGISSINLAKEVNDRIINGEFSWAHDFKNLHPSPFGHGIYTQSIRAALGSLLSQVETEERPLPYAIDQFSYSHAKLVDINQAHLKNDWKIVSAWRPIDSLGTRGGFVDVPALEAVDPGASLTLNFTGKAIGILVAAGSDVGKLNYQIDDLVPQKIDQFTQWSHFLHLPWLYMLNDELTEGPHTLILTTAADKNRDSKGYACRIFYFAVNE